MVRVKVIAIVIAVVLIVYFIRRRKYFFKSLYGGRFAPSSTGGDRHFFTSLVYFNPQNGLHRSPYNHLYHLSDRRNCLRAEKAQKRKRIQSRTTKPRINPDLDEGADKAKR